jgi:hypothetical protein
MDRLTITSNEHDCPSQLLVINIILNDGIKPPQSHRIKTVI